MDYALPRADDIPKIVSLLDEDQPCPHNPLGAKGCGAPAAIVSAALDALKGLGVTGLQLPLTPERIWKAMQSVKR
jgi:carbon-monoxide dehydrogenase large subunit